MKKRILIVDDELDFLHIMKLMLDGTGRYQVWAVHSASQAPHVAREFKLRPFSTGSILTLRNRIEPLAFESKSAPPAT